MRSGPAWLSAGAAVAGTIIAAVVAFGVVNQARPIVPPAPTAVGPAALEPRVTLDSVSAGGQEVAADGAFENVDPTIMEVLFLGRPAGPTDEHWVGVSASLVPAESNGSLTSGRWSAAWPVPAQSPYQWRAILWPIAQGAAGDDDLSINGPDSEYVIARSEEWPSQ